MASSPDIPTLSLTETEELEPPAKKLRIGGLAEAGGGVGGSGAEEAATVSERWVLQTLSDGRVEGAANLLLMESVSPAARVRLVHRVISERLSDQFWLERLEPLLAHVAGQSESAVCQDVAQEMVLFATSQAAAGRLGAVAFLQSLLSLACKLADSATTGLLLCCLESLRRLHDAAQIGRRDDELSELVRELLAVSVCRSEEPRLVAQAAAAIGRALAPRDSVARVQCRQLAAFLADDADARVRLGAHSCQLQWLRRGLEAPSALEAARAALERDEDEAVRAVCVHLLLAAALRLRDPPACSAAFHHLATCMLDSSQRVRVRAAEALGQLSGLVPTPELAATLDRQVMTDLRLRRSNGAPIGDLEVKDVTLLSLGASGAFVNGFEDDSSAVRAAAIRSVCQLAQRCPAFAEICADSLVDMLTDDIHAVRLAAVQSLGRLDFQLSRRQLHVCLGALKEGNSQLRWGLHAVLASCGLADAACLKALLAGLLDNIARYPADKEEVWQCAASVGGRHCALVQLSVGELLCLHPYLQGTEPVKEEPSYTTVFLAVLNAAARLPQLRSLLPHYAERHYAYLREALPQLTPALSLRPGAGLVGTVGDVCGGGRGGGGKGGGGGGVREFFWRTVGRVAEELEAGDSCLLRLLLADLAKAARLDGSLAGAASFVRDWCRCATLAASRESLQPAIAVTYRLQLLYCGLGQRLLHRLAELRAELRAGRVLPAVPLPQLPDGLRRTSARLLEPRPSEEIRRFAAAQPLVVRARARLWYCDHLHALRLCLRLPDRRRVDWTPAAAHWTQLPGHSLQQAAELTTCVQFTCQQWTEPASVSVSLAVAADDCEIPLTQSVSISVLPLPPRKS